MRAKEFEDGRVRQAGLTRRLPFPALKEAERFGSYNPSALNTLTRGIARHGTVQGHSGTSNARRAFATLRIPEEDTHRKKKSVFEALTRDRRSVLRRD